MNTYKEIKKYIRANPKKWLITGIAGFIGSNLLEVLLNLDQHVIGLDNFLTGHKQNLDEVKLLVTGQQWGRFELINGDIRDLRTCLNMCKGVDIVLHEAALGSVPRSIENPIATNDHNLTGFLNIISAARDAGVKRFVYASSSSVYGDHPDLPKTEDKIGKPLSPYAVTKQVNKKYANVSSRIYGLQCIGLRYFNVFGPRQDPNGPYAAVIPKCFASLRKGEDVFIYGDGETSRDFCFVDNVIHANILTAYTENHGALNTIDNIAYGGRTTLKELYYTIHEEIAGSNPAMLRPEPIYKDFRPGDIRHSIADISKAQQFLGYEPLFSSKKGLEKAVKWYQ